jgi:hypothetical protein
MAFVAGPRSPGRLLHARAQLRTPLSQRQARTVPDGVMRRVEVQEDGVPLARMWSVLAPSGAVVVRPEFHGGPGAAIEFKF